MKKTTSTTKKRKKRTERSPRQQWHSEREWAVLGVLTSCITKIHKIADLPSTLNNERLWLHDLAGMLYKQLQRMKRQERKEESFKQWKDQNVKE